MKASFFAAPTAPISDMELCATVETINLDLPTSSSVAEMMCLHQFGEGDIYAELLEMIQIALEK